MLLQLCSHGWEPEGQALSPVCSLHLQGLGWGWLGPAGAGWGWLGLAGAGWVPEHRVQWARGWHQVSSAPV